jgi:hypothetical protein
MAITVTASIDAAAEMARFYATTNTSTLYRTDRRIASFQEAILIET